jgi:hypothetical protein
VNQIKFSKGTVTGNGAGQTIAIVDAYNDPNIASDLAKFDSQYGLPAPPSFVVDNLGATTTNAGWALETSLDVEWAHALAPKANIVLVEAQSSSLSSLFSAVSSASKLKGVSVVSMSWGTPEFWGEWNYDSLFTTPSGHNGVAYVASSGDSGAWYGPMYPSVSPNVLAVGGTSLSLGSNNTYGSETGWTDSTGGFSGADNWFQFYETAPSYQVAAQQAVGLNYGVRTTPDVSFNADPNTGVAVYDSVAYGGQKGWFEVGGTSAAAPAWAGLIAIADQGLATGGKAPLTSTQVLTDLYNSPSSDYHDITSGSNGYSATPGYDLVTGLGTPKANSVVAGLLAANGVSEGTVVKNSTALITVTATSSTTNRFVASSTSSSSAPLGSITNTTAAASSTSLGPLAALPSVQTLSAQTGTSSGRALLQQAAASVPLSPSSLSQTALGQGLMQQSVLTSQSSEQEVQTSWLIAQSELDAPAAPSPQRPQQQEPIAEPEPMIGPCVPPEAGDPTLEPNIPQLDAALEQIGEGSLFMGGRGPAPTSPNTEEDRQAKTVEKTSVLFGTAIVVAGGYRLAASDVNRRQRRWIPGRILARP